MCRINSGFVTTYAVPTPSKSYIDHYNHCGSTARATRRWGRRRSSRWSRRWSCCSRDQQSIERWSWQSQDLWIAVIGASTELLGLLLNIAQSWAPGGRWGCRWWPTWGSMGWGKTLHHSWSTSMGTSTHFQAPLHNQDRRAGNPASPSSFLAQDSHLLQTLTSQVLKISSPEMGNHYC